MRDMVGAIEAEYRRYRKLADDALAQVDDAQLHLPAPGGGNSLAVLVQHVAGNLASRFTDFLTADGEKPWRDRESEFARTGAARGALVAAWDRGWSVLGDALAPLTDADLGRTVTIRGQALSVREALLRSLAHASSHVGQIVLLARSLRGEAWTSLSIPPGGSAAYNAHPDREKPPASPAVEQLAAAIEAAFTGPCWHGPSLAQVLEGVDARTAAARPAPGVHSIAEQALHVVFWAEDTRLRLAGATPPNPAPEADWPAVDALDDEDWLGVKEELREAHLALAAAVRALDASRLADAVPGRRETIEVVLRGIPGHAAYHGGQAALLKRILRDR